MTFRLSWLSESAHILSPGLGLPYFTDQSALHGDFTSVLSPDANK